MSALQATIAAIDTANGEDPTDRDGQPLAQAQGQAASRWLARLDPTATDELQLAARGHHLRRWELRRAHYPEGRQGYIDWRRHNKAHQAKSLAALMTSDGWPPESVERAQVLLSRTKLRTDAETQSLEDAACLVFLETQFGDMAERTDHDHLVSIVAKTLKKMSADAVTLAGSIGLSATAQAVLADAVTLLGDEDSHDS